MGNLTDPPPPPSHQFSKYFNKLIQFFYIILPAESSESSSSSQSAPGEPNILYKIADPVTPVVRPTQNAGARKMARKSAIFNKIPALFCKFIQIYEG